MQLLSALFSLGVLPESRLCLDVTFLLLILLAKYYFCHLFQLRIKIIACFKFSVIRNSVGISQAVMAELFGMMGDRTSQRC